MIREPGDRLRRSRYVAAFVPLLLSVLVAACGAGVGGTAVARGAAPPGFPVTVTNCGMTTTYQRPPQRVVTMNQHATEIMLALGLEDRMIGTAYLDDRILPEYRDEYRRIPVLAERYPSYEVLLAAAPDFVYAGFASAFSEQEGRSRQRLREAGVKTHVNPQDCTSGPTTMQQLWNELRTVATIFGVEQRAQALIEQLKGELAAVTRALGDVEPVSVFVYNSGTKAPLTPGGHAMASTIVRLAGGGNVFAGLNRDRAITVSWEQVIRRNPQAIVILEYGSTSVAEKKQALLSNAALADIPAIKKARFAVLPLSATVLGVRAPRAVAELARQLHPGRFQ